MLDSGPQTPEGAGGLEQRDMNKICLFGQAIDAMREEDREPAREYLQIKQRWAEFNDTHPEGYDELNAMLKDFFFALIQEDQEKLRRTNIFHLFFGSSRTLQRWSQSPLCSEDGAFENFLASSFVPRLEEIEKS